MDDDLSRRLQRARVYDLAQPYYAGMPHHPTHPPFLFGMIKLHGDFVTPAGGSSAADAFAGGSHVGTHIDALSHFSLCGQFHGGKPVTQSITGGVGDFSVDTIGPIVRRGVLLDLAGLLNSGEPLASDFLVTPAHLDTAVERQGVRLEPGDVVLLRTGWAQYWHDARRFLAQMHMPGPGLDGAQWLSARGIFAAGSDTVAFERQPDASMPVHLHLLVEHGIHIIECLNLEQLARDQAWNFTFVASPMKLAGATGAPLSPLAFAER